MMTLIIIVISFLVFLFCLYKLTKEDYVFIRKNLNPEQIFNIAFSAGWCGLLFARIVFILSHPDPKFFNPLVFLAFPKYPGLSLPGAVIGGILFLILLSYTKKMPLGRLLDFFSLAFLCTLPVTFILSELQGSENHLFLAILLPLLYTVFAVFFMKLLYPRLIRGQLKESAIAQLFFITFSIISIFTGIARREPQDFFTFSFEEYAVLVLFLLSLGIFLQRELIGKPERRVKK